MNVLNENQTERQIFTIKQVNVPEKAMYLFFKRLFDVSVSFCAGVVLLLPMCLIAVLIYLDDRGPVIYQQERLGKDGKAFMIYKFRSMIMDAEIDGPQWAKERDQRCTRFGAILRKTRLDELPQLWNIFVGDMSFVGPRPERAYFYEEFEKYIHGFKQRLIVTPGLTGLAQVNGGYDLKPEEKILLDIEYIENMSLKMDILCLLKTFKLVFTHKGAR